MTSASSDILDYMLTISISTVRTRLEATRIYLGRGKTKTSKHLAKDIANDIEYEEARRHDEQPTKCLVAVEESSGNISGGNGNHTGTEAL
jgi:hypothetical protein